MHPGVLRVIWVTCAVVKRCTVSSNAWHFSLPNVAVDNFLDIIIMKSARTMKMGATQSNAPVLMTDMIAKRDQYVKKSICQRTNSRDVDDHVAGVFVISQIE